MNDSKGTDSGRDTICPRTFCLTKTEAPDAYLADNSVRKLLECFGAKGLATLKDEDRLEQWYADWIAYQREHSLYASLLSPKRYSSRGSELDIARLCRFLEVFGYCSPAHGYSLQVTFLGLFPILMGSSEALKREAVAVLEAGGLLALGVSEKGHGADLLGNDFTVTESDGRLVANGGKYYIGNSNCASIISVLARKIDDRKPDRGRRAPPVFFALRPKQSPGYRDVRKIRTLGVRQAYVGELEVKDHEVAPDDLFAEGRQAWDAMFGTVALGKFFLGFGSIGICEHAMSEAVQHLSGRILYGKPAIEMPHLRSTMSQAYARLAAMKLYAYRALDYVQSASADDRRYLLYCAVQKARVSTEGVKTIALLSECIGAKGFESDTFFEMALRDAALIPALEGSTHINLEQASQFIVNYFTGNDADIVNPPSLLAGEAASGENPYLMEAKAGAVTGVKFPDPLAAYHPFASLPNVRLFAKQVKAFSLLVRRKTSSAAILHDPEGSLLMGKCLAAIAYGQVIIEHCTLLCVETQSINAIFELLVTDLSTLALPLTAHPLLDKIARAAVTRLIVIPRTCAADWELVSEKMASVGRALPAN